MKQKYLRIKFLIQISLSEENSLHVVKTYPLYLSTINGGIRTEKEFVTLGIELSF